MHHELKILPQYFEPVCDGTKTFEIRNNDRDFNAGDTATLREWTGENYTWSELEVEITYVTNYEQKPGWVVFGIKVKGETDNH
ncbi:DUF3850 domain-containing protein [Photobacterium sp. TY1-4]|uniref:DUF3850 domain-containing protein n=1 Tax=Photobacterium sp. TY1-4 TaxID=2899122 RepID=UPI0021C23552|nr:DUF3850 domain-containing protein [Photobacterium sp. TY1-4]UXI00447.1 DUF3850 domain-containing protein [Photobacterium sp. TY1-4]